VSEGNLLRRAAFLDRDGTLNPDLKYLREPGRLELFPGVADGIRWLRSLGYLAVCVTNQSGVGRGLYSEHDVERIHDRLNELLRARGAMIDAFYYCPHTPEAGCECRKPRTELFERASREMGIRLSRSAIIGDRSLDIKAGSRLGLLSALVIPPGHEEAVEEELKAELVEPDIRARTFASAAARILAAG
jgi:histidinol-phosphate phosphatase family protein